MPMRVCIHVYVFTHSSFCLFVRDGEVEEMEMEKGWSFIGAQFFKICNQEKGGQNK